MDGWIDGCWDRWMGVWVGHRDRSMSGRMDESWLDGWKVG